MSTQRYRLMGDDSGHDYAIPVELAEEFEAWVYTEAWDGPGFDAYRVEGGLTFVDPQYEDGTPAVPPL